MNKNQFRKKKIQGVLLALMVAVALILNFSFGADASMAEQTTSDDPLVVTNDAGQKVVINVEEELTPEEAATVDAELEAAGDNAVTSNAKSALAGFVKPDTNQDQNIHLIWMVLLLLAAIAYVSYFNQYQSKLFDLRRSIAKAEFEVRKEKE